MQLIFLAPQDSVEKERRLIARYCGIDSEVMTGNAYVHASCGDFDLVWERHSEFSSYMFIRSGVSSPAFCPTTFEALPKGWLSGLPGTLVRATQIALATREDENVIAEGFAAADLVSCDIAGRAARMWSDFRLNDSGFGRLLLVIRGLNGTEAALAVQRLQELGNYRNMALLGLPVAQKYTPTVTRFEQQLTALTASIASGGKTDDVLLHELSVLSAELAEVMAETRYRMSASRAYAKIATERLLSLRIDRIAGFQTLADFTDRRLLPAVRTCASFSSRLEDLSQRVAWTTSLLRTRVDTALSHQNRDLLASMDRRTDLQLRLQQTVEGLSTVAISYYLLALLGYLIRGFEPYVSLQHDVILATALPVAMTGVWLTIRRIRKKTYH